jgi:hypothetical protein
MEQTQMALFDLNCESRMTLIWILGNRGAEMRLFGRCSAGTGLISTDLGTIMVRVRSVLPLNRDLPDRVRAAGLNSLADHLAESLETLDSKRRTDSKRDQTKS